MFHDSGAFTAAPGPDGQQIAELFRHKVLKMLPAKGKITPERIALMDNRRHTGFNVYVGPRILPWHSRSMENLARYIIRASFSRERMTYERESAEVVYRSKGGSAVKVFDALEWLAAMSSHIPNKGEQMVRYYGLQQRLQGKTENMRRGRIRGPGRRGHRLYSGTGADRQRVPVHLGQVDPEDL